MNVKIDPDIEVIAYEPKHAIEIKVRPHDEALKGSEEYAKWAEINAIGGAFSGRRKSDGKIMACAGIRVLWPGVGEAWAIFSDEVEKYPKEAYVLVAHFALQLIKDFGLKRLQAYCDTDNPLAVKYLENLGFKREGLLRKYARDGKDQFIYSIIFGD